MATRIQVRRDSAANWASVNPVLAEGEIGCDLDTTQIKIGNGSDAWNDLPYTAGDGSLWLSGSGFLRPAGVGDKVRANAATEAADDNLTLVTKGYLESLDVTVSDAAPSGAVQGQLWWNTDVGRMFIYYVDADSTEQWVETAPSQNFLYWERTGTAVHPASDGDSVFVGDNGDGTAAIELNPNGSSQFTGDMVFLDNTDTPTVTVSAQTGNISLTDGITISGNFEFTGDLEIDGQVDANGGISIAGGDRSDVGTGVVGSGSTGLEFIVDGYNAGLIDSQEFTFGGITRRSTFSLFSDNLTQPYSLYPQSNGTRNTQGGITVRNKLRAENWNNITTASGPDGMAPFFNVVWTQDQPDPGGLDGPMPSIERGIGYFYGHVFNGNIIQRGAFIEFSTADEPGANKTYMGILPTQMKAGAEYVILDNGSGSGLTPTNFVQFGAANNDVGTTFTCTTDADGTTAADGLLQFNSVYSGHAPTKITFGTNPNRAEETSGSYQPIRRLEILPDGALHFVDSPGIDFSGINGTSLPSANAAIDAETLGNYETGTFDPIPAAVASQLTGEYVSNARYTRVGNVVTVDIRVQWASNTSVTDPFRFQLPYSPLDGSGVGANTTIGNAGGFFYSGNQIRSGVPIVSHAGGADFLAFYEQNATGFTELQVGDFTGGAYDVMTSITYLAGD